MQENPKKYEILQNILLEVIDYNNKEVKSVFLSLFEHLGDIANASVRGDSRVGNLDFRDSSLNAQNDTAQPKNDSIQTHNDINHTKNPMQKLKDLLHEISESAHLADIIKACSLYNIILNIYEEQEEAKIASVSKSIESAYQSLQKDGFDRADCNMVLESIRFYPVFTAHPTESRRRTFLEAHQEITKELDNIDHLLHMDTHNYDGEMKKSCENIKYRLNLLWKSHLVRSEKLEVIFELDNLLFIVENSIIPSALHVLNQVSNKLNKPLKFSPIKLGSWIGGDRDGNPYVSNELMTKVMKMQHEVIINTYIKEINKLFRELSISADLCHLSEKLEKSLQSEVAYLNQASQKMHQREPFRAKLFLMKQKLQNHLLKVNSPNPIDFTYENPNELIEDIDMLISSLDELSSRRLKSFRNLVLLGGFHLMQLDFREHRDNYIYAVAEVLCKLGYTDSDFATQSESKKIEILNKALSEPPINLNSILWEVSIDARRTLNAFLRVLWAKNAISKDVLKSFIVSMTTSASDLLSVLYLAYCSSLWQRGKSNESGESIKEGHAQIFITPLFETIDDLENASGILESLANNAHYRQYLNDLGNAQQIMIGYSDSSKNGGIFTASYSLYKAIDNLMKLEERLGLHFMLFHGKGGSVSRGGGELENSLFALPMRSIGTTLKTTEQGEIISSRYLNPKIAIRSFALTLSSLFKKSVYDYFGVNMESKDSSHTFRMTKDVMLSGSETSLESMEKQNLDSKDSSHSFIMTDSYPQNDTAQPKNDETRNTTKIHSMKSSQDNEHFMTRESKHYTQTLDEISQISYNIYRDLAYNTHGFMTYFKNATPIEFIQNLNLGSRPSKRKDSQSIEDLRAIPWVFAWTQNRSIIPAWYGLGSALASIGEVSLLRECYEDSVFFKTTIDNIARGFINVDMDIASEYNAFVENAELRNAIWSKIYNEYQTTLQWLLIVRNEDKLLQNSLESSKILNRMPSIKALSLLQIELIKKYRKAKYEELKHRLMEQIHGTIIGIAQGIRNTG